MPICAECGQEHPVHRLEIAFVRPDAVVQLDPQARKRRVQENDDLCVLDGDRFFIRALLPLSVDGWKRPYQIGLWVEVSLSAFQRVYALWDESLRGEEHTFPATVANSIPTLPQTFGLAATLTGPSTRPSITLQPVEHPLFGYQSRGISAHRAAEFGRLSARAPT